MNIDEKALYIQLGERIRVARKKAGWSEDTLALNLALARSSVTNIESGTQRPPIHVVYQIAVALGADLSRLLPGMNAVVVELTEEEELKREQLLLKESIESATHDLGVLKFRLEEVKRMLEGL